jgi:ATP-dependent DNA helicase RecG
MELGELGRIVAAGESETVEFKKSTALLARAGEALCGFLNGRGGRVFLGVTPEGRIAGQQVGAKAQKSLPDALVDEAAENDSGAEPPGALPDGGSRPE